MDASRDMPRSSILSINIRLRHGECYPVDPNVENFCLFFRCLQQQTCYNSAPEARKQGANTPRRGANMPAAGWLGPPQGDKHASRRRAGARPRGAHTGQSPVPIL
eukprot:1765211-Rhodomonas_salina.1